MEGDFRGAVPACGHGAASCARGGIALERADLPGAADEGFGHLAGDDDGVAARKAELAPVGMPAELEVESCR